MHIFENIRAQRGFNLLDKQRFDQIEKKITELKNTLQNCKLPKNLLLKIELENNDEINASQITKTTSVANLEAVCNKKIVFF